MARIKIDYGIDLGTTNSAIARMESGEPTIKKSLDNQKDTVPSCISVMKNKKTTRVNVEIGDKALAQLGVDRRLEFLDKGYTSNVFIEFKRTMGTDKIYHSSNLDKDFLSEELAAEILKKLKQPIFDEVINAVVVTVPAKFGANQKEATKKAAELAGFEQCELLSEPVAAAYAYGIKSKSKDGYWVVFDFGGGTFDAALLKVEDGIFKVISTEGDNYLGGKNIDFAIIDEILLPYFKENYELDEILKDDSKLLKFRNQFKDKAEQLKIALSAKTEEPLISQLGEDFGKDDSGTPFEFDISVTRDQLDLVQGPFFKQAVQITKELLKRNNLNENQIDSLILVGGPTLTPLLREILTKQITKKIDTSVDPMTVVAKGAALFASTINIEDGILAPLPKGSVELEINYESTTVDTDVLINIKCKNYGDFNSGKVYAEIHRSDGAWSSSRTELNQKAKLFDLTLKESMPNNFSIITYDSKGNIIDCSPNSFTILQGIGDASGGGVNLPHHYGIEIKNRKTNRMEFDPLQGLKKDTLTPAIGIKNNLTTSSQIRPGMKQDFIRIPLYQGNNDAKESRAIYNEHVYDIEITGEDLPALLPADSTFDLTIYLDRNEGISGKANFHKLDYQHEFVINKNFRQPIPATYKIESEFRDSFRILEEIEKANVLSDLKSAAELKQALIDLQRYFEKGKSDDDRRKEVFDKMREILKKVDELDKGTTWYRLEKDIRREFERLEDANSEVGNHKTNEAIEELRTKVDRIIIAKDSNLGREALEEVETMFVSVTLIYQLISSVSQWDKNFNSIEWKNPQKVRGLLNQALQIIANNPSEEKLLAICIECENNLPDQICNGCGRKKSQCVCVS